MALTQEQLNRILGNQSVVDRVLSTNAIEQKLNAPENIVTGGILPIQKNKVTGQMALAMPEFIKSIQQAYTAPARAMRGEFDPNSIQGVQEANNVALNLLGVGSAPAIGKPRQQGSLGITAYHGSPLKKLSELNPKKSFGRLGVSWVSPSEDFAKKYIGKEGTVYKVDLNEGKNFDFSNPENLNLLREKAKNIEYYDPVRGFTTLDKRVPETSSYYSAEDPMLFNLIKKLGYDTVSVTENGVKNIGVFNPKKNAKIIK